MIRLTEPNVFWLPIGYAPADTTLIRSQLHWYSGTPWELTLTFGEQNSTVVWTIGRELFRAALLSGRAGIGDVCIHVAENRLLLELHSPGKMTTLSTSAQSIRAFIDRTYGVVSDAAEDFAVQRQAEDWANCI